MTIVSGKLGASLMHSSSPRRRSARVCNTHEGGLHRSGDDEGHAERETSTYRKRLMTFDIDDPLHRDFLKAVQDRGPRSRSGKTASTSRTWIWGVYPDESLKETGEAHAQTSTWSDCCDPSSVCLPSRRRRNASFFGSAEELNRERSRQESSGHCIIHPCSVFRMYWDLCLTVLLVANLVLIPVDVAFYADPGDLYWMAFHLTSDAIFFVDIVFNFRTGVITTEGVERVNLGPKGTSHATI
ncbi:hypothetical protein MRX96_017124 [Rhipicephalus microplus]